MDYNFGYDATIIQLDSKYYTLYITYNLLENYYLL